ncbi:hypothetical protein BY996DRAFT_6623481 [Phakopsora pachyrhizi]|nr:hypothetical protein BY996DRAFT_6623481 [Phakopsora pachyrhizi]
MRTKPNEIDRYGVQYCRIDGKETLWRDKLKAAIKDSGITEVKLFPRCYKAPQKEKKEREDKGRKITEYIGPLGDILPNKFKLKCQRYTDQQLSSQFIYYLTMRSQCRSCHSPAPELHKYYYNITEKQRFKKGGGDEQAIIIITTMVIISPRSLTLSVYGREEARIHFFYALDRLRGVLLQIRLDTKLKKGVRERFKRGIKQTELIKTAPLWSIFIPLSGFIPINATVPGETDASEEKKKKKSVLMEGLVNKEEKRKEDKKKITPSSFRHLKFCL